MRRYKVGTFFHQLDGKDPTLVTSYRAYLRDYSTAWQGCREFEIEDHNGEAAKRQAILRRMAEELELRREVS